MDKLTLKEKIYLALGFIFLVAMSLLFSTMFGEEGGYILSVLLVIWVAVFASKKMKSNDYEVLKFGAILTSGEFQKIEKGELAAMTTPLCVRCLKER